MGETGEWLAERLAAELLDSLGLSEAEASLLSASDAKSKNGDNLVLELIELVDALDWPALREKWSSLCSRVFNNLTAAQSEYVDELESDLYKLFLSRCVVKGEKKLCAAFLQEMTATLQTDSGWTEWLTLPYVPEPREHPVFKKYFSKQFKEVYLLSLHNFFNMIIGSRKLPLLCQIAERAKECDEQPERSSVSESISEDDLAFVAGDEMSPAMGSVDEELLDEFAVIAQCSGPLRSTSKQSLKSLIKNISSKRLNEEKPKPPPST